MDAIKSLLVKGAKEYGIQLTQAQVEQFLLYKSLLVEWNQKINLTAIEEDQEIILKHFVDSLSIDPYIEQKGVNLIDIGTGAGFPGIPIKIIHPNLHVTLLDSLDKRVKFLNTVTKALGLQTIEAIHARAEDAGRAIKYREKFDMGVARAVAALPVLLEYCLPFIKVGGLFIAMKGSNIEEVASSEKSLQILGGQIERVEKIQLPFTDMDRNIVMVRKLRQTPTLYPRKAGKPSKEPLG